MSSGNVVRRASQNAGMIDRARAIPDRLFVDRRWLVTATRMMVGFSRQLFEIIGALGEIRTPDPRNRNLKRVQKSQ
jgi:hypothetical protein